MKTKKGKKQDLFEIGGFVFYSECEMSLTNSCT